MLYAVIVLYNKKCSESVTLETLKSYQNKINIIIFDNSEKDFKNKEYCEKAGYIYYSFEKNMGLSKAYNYVISKLEKKDNDYIMILDDDTELNENYIEEVLEKISLDYDLLIPHILAKNILLSPSKVTNYGRVKSVADTSSLNENNITAINSGMVVKLSLYDTIHYNESLFLDYVDHDFMHQARQNHAKYFILSSSIYQNYSRQSKPSLNSALHRFAIFKKDFKTYCFTYKYILFYYGSILKLLFKHTWQYKTLEFIKIYFGR